MIVATIVLLLLAAAGFAVRLVWGPSLADRVIALDGLLIVVIAILAVDAVRRDTSWFIDAALVIGLLGYVGTGVSARFIERRGG
jgi:multicomponent Na+:H+ antiporter subunit F